MFFGLWNSTESLFPGSESIQAADGRSSPCLNHRGHKCCCSADCVKIEGLSLQQRPCIIEPTEKYAFSRSMHESSKAHLRLQDVCDLRRRTNKRKQANKAVGMTTVDETGRNVPFDLPPSFGPNPKLAKLDKS